MAIIITASLYSDFITQVKLDQKELLEIFFLIGENNLTYKLSISEEINDRIWIGIELILIIYIRGNNKDPKVNDPKWYKIQFVNINL